MLQAARCGARLAGPAPATGSWAMLFFSGRPDDIPKPNDLVTVRLAVVLRDCELHDRVTSRAFRATIFSCCPNRTYELMQADQRGGYRLTSRPVVNVHFCSVHEQKRRRR